MGGDKHNVGDGSAYGNRVDIFTGRGADGFPDREMLLRLFHQQEEIYKAMMGDMSHPRTNPGMLAIVEETRDKLDETRDRISSLVAANAAQGLRQDTADRERKLLAENQQALIDSHTRYQKKNDEKVGVIIGQVGSIASRHTFIMVALGLMMAALISGGAYMFYISLRLFG